MTNREPPVAKTNTRLRSRESPCSSPKLRPTPNLCSCNIVTAMLLARDTVHSRTDRAGRKGDRTTSEREFFRRRITMLLSPNSAVVFFCGFE